MLIKSRKSSLKSQGISQSTTSKPSHVARTSRNRTESDEIEILSRVCCPNCRYVFKTVNEGKLNAARKRLEQLNIIQEERSQYADSHRQATAAVQDLFPTHTIDEDLSNFLQVNSIAVQTVNDLSVDKQASFALISPIHPKDASRKSSRAHNERFFPHRPAKSKTPKRKEQKSLQEQINLMKEFLRGQPDSRQQFYQPEQTPRQYEEKTYPARRLNLGPGRQQADSSSYGDTFALQVWRECEKCSRAPISQQLITEAAKGLERKKQIRLMSEHYPPEGDMPSYLKYLTLTMDSY